MEDREVGCVKSIWSSSSEESVDSSIRDGESKRFATCVPTSDSPIVCCAEVNSLNTSEFEFVDFNESINDRFGLRLKPPALSKSRTKRKRRRYFKIPRLCMNDIRRHYGTMLARVFNCGDEDYGQRFVRSFCRDNSPVRMHGFHSRYMHGIKPNALCPLMCALSYGMSMSLNDWIHEAIFVMKGLFPDIVCYVRNERIIRRLDDRRCIIEIDLEVEFSILLAGDFVSLMHHLYDKKESCTPTIRKEPTLLATPSKFQHMYSLSLQVGELKNIESIALFPNEPPSYVMPLLQHARDISLR